MNPLRRKEKREGERKRGREAEKKRGREKEQTRRWECCKMVFSGLDTLVAHMNS